jgi:hypothetical protein
MSTKFAQYYRSVCFLACGVFLSSAQHANAQSEASVAESIAAPSVFVAEGIGNALGAGAGLTLGAVVVSTSASILVIETTATTAAKAAQYTLEVPLEIAKRLQHRKGARIDTVQSDLGTELRVDNQVISFLANPANQTSKPRTAL